MRKLADDMPRDPAPEQPAGVFGGLMRKGVKFDARMSPHREDCHLPARLSTAGAPEGIGPAVGDIAYYAPWGNLVLFYRDFGYSKGLGRVEGDRPFDSTPCSVLSTASGTCQGPAHASG